MGNRRRRRRRNTPGQTKWLTRDRLDTGTHMIVDRFSVAALRVLLSRADRKTMQDALRVLKNKTPQQLDDIIKAVVESDKEGETPFMKSTVANALRKVLYFSEDLELALKVLEAAGLGKVKDRQSLVETSLLFLLSGIPDGFVSHCAHTVLKEVGRTETFQTYKEMVRKGALSIETFNAATRLALSL